MACQLRFEPQDKDGRALAGTTRASAWLPKQYGAYAMVIVPFTLGLAMAASWAPLQWWHLALSLFWLSGYLAFNALSTAAKSGASKRDQFRQPIIVYVSLAAAFGVATLILGGWKLLAWIPVFAPLLGLASWYAIRHRERDFVSGLCTILAACLMVLVPRYPNPLELLQSPDKTLSLTILAIMFGYFAGTIFYIKTLIRERGKTSWRIASWAWHGAWLLAVIVFQLGWYWALFFAATLLRSILVPVVCTRPKMMFVGLGEVGLSLVGLAIGIVEIFQ